MLLAMVISIVFVVLDVLTVTNAFRLSGFTGINPFWKLAMVFKCLTDTVILDDFKTALNSLVRYKARELREPRWINDHSDLAVNDDSERRRHILAVAENRITNSQSLDGRYVRLNSLPSRPQPALRINKEVVVHIEHSA